MGVATSILQPEASGLVIRCRMDGVLQHVGTFSSGEKADIVTRLKVLAGLLTYQTDVPQEGRLRESVAGIEMRVSTIPTVFGERAVVRMFGARADLSKLQQLGLPNDILSELHRILSETSGALLITGPAGSGKTTTAYACLRELVSQNAGGRNLVSLEDPVEVVVEGVSQSQSNAAAGFDITTGLKSILRQDPEVIFIGEIRDRDTAAVALQAALTGQLVISTFHAGSAAEAVSRLIEMDIEPYVLRSVLRGIISQRLVRRLCTCGKTTSDPQHLLGLPLPTATVATGCGACSQTGYQGRMMIAELLSAQESSIGAAILDRQDTDSHPSASR